MKLYHMVSGKVYCAPEWIESLEPYKAWVRKAYGNLSGVKFGTGENRSNIEWEN